VVLYIKSDTLELTFVTASLVDCETNRDDTNSYGMENIKERTGRVRKDFYTETEFSKVWSYEKFMV